MSIRLTQTSHRFRLQSHSRRDGSGAVPRVNLQPNKSVSSPPGVRAWAPRRVFRAATVCPLLCLCRPRRSRSIQDSTARGRAREANWIIIWCALAGLPLRHLWKRRSSFLQSANESAVVIRRPANGQRRAAIFLEKSRRVERHA